MIRLYLPPHYQGAFLSYLSRYARPSLQVLPTPGGLLLREAEPTDVAAALTLGAFPCYERALLQKLLSKHFAGFSPEEQLLMLELTPRLISQAPEGDTLYAGYRRPLRLAQALAEALNSGRLDFQGFCRFRLSGYEEFLHYILTMAADEVLSREEDESYARLLRIAAQSPQGQQREIHLFFCPQGVCRIWERTPEGIRDKEGGSYLGMEATLVANVIEMHPNRLVIHDPQEAAAEILQQLEQAFGSALSWEGNPAGR